MRIQHTVPTTTTERPHTVDFRPSTLCVLVRVFNDGQVLAREKAKASPNQAYVCAARRRETNQRTNVHARTFFFFFGFLTPPTSSPSALSSFLDFLGDDDELLDFLPFLRFSRLLPRRFSLARFRLSVRDLDRDLLLFFFLLLFLPFLLFFFLSWRGLLLLLVVVFQTTVYMRYKPNIRPRAPYNPAAPRLLPFSIHTVERSTTIERHLKRNEIL